MPYSILVGKGNHGASCQKCSTDHFDIKKSTEEFKAEVQQKVGSEYSVIGEYINNKTPILMKHNVCGKTFMVRPDNFLFVNSRCPHCVLGSKGQDALCDFIKEIYNGKIIENYSLKNKKEIDVYLPEKKIGFEFDGLYWHSEQMVGKTYAKDKTDQANAEGIRLIHVFEDEWLKKTKIVKSKISAILGIKPAMKIYARKCIVKVLTPDVKKSFLNDNHIQGNDSANISLGLYYNDTLVSVMTFCKARLGIGHFSKIDNLYELSRFANNIDYNVIGSFKKLLTYFAKNYTFDKIVSYADLRWSSESSNIYLKNNFKEGSKNNPNYWYFKDKTRYHRFAFRKNALKEKFPDIYDDKLTESEIMEKTQYRRVWDCGTIRYDIDKQDILS